MRKLALIFGLVCMNAVAEESQFGLICETSNGSFDEAQTFMVDLEAKTVDGRKAKITEATISFVKNNKQYEIDRTNGDLDISDLRPALGTGSAGPLRKCKKAPPKQF